MDPMSRSREVSKIVLAYSGGLDTSVILRWLIETYRADVIAFCADLGQGEELDLVRETIEQSRAQVALGCALCLLFCCCHADRLATTWGP